MVQATREATRDIVIGAFKTYAYLIFEISKDEVINNLWAKDPQTETQFRQQLVGKNILSVTNGDIVNQSSQHIARAFETGETGLIEYNLTDNETNTPVKFIIRIIPAPYDSQYVLSIMEQVKKEDNAEVVEDKWKLALDASGDGMWDVNMQTNKMFFSPKWHELFGYEKDEIATVEDWRSKIHPDDIAVSQQKFADYLEGKVPAYVTEARFKCKDGSYRWILSRGIIASHTPDGKPYRFVGTHTDIDARKQQELLIEQSERRYKILYDYAEAMICTHDLDGKILGINPYVTRSLGYDVDELIGTNLIELIPIYLRTRFQSDYLDNIIANGSAEGLMHILTKAGDVRTLLYKNFLFHGFDNNPYIIGFAQDITERIKMEEALKQSVDTFSAAFNNSAIGMALISQDGNWLEVNEALRQMLGYSMEELQQSNFQTITHPDDLAEDMALLDKLLNKTIDSYSLEKRYIAKDGRIIWGALTVACVWNKNGTPKFIISQIVDITRRKELTSELFNKNIELELAQNSLLNKISQLEELSYIIAHNLRGPARNINLLSQALKAKYDDTDASDDVKIMSEAMSTEEGIFMVQEAGSSLINSLESLLNIAQIRLDKNIPFDTCNFEDLLIQVVSQLKGDIIEKNVEVTTELEVPEMLYPKPYLESILYNLVSNAIKYRNPAVNCKIHISTARENGKIKLSVRDNGLGIDLEKYGNRIFKLNQVFHSGQDSKGIGLFMIKTQIEALGGTISLKSKVNEGTDFIIMFKEVKG